MAFYANFEIDIVSALADQLLMAFASLETAPLAREGVDELHKGQGVYQLYHLGILVYAGKADNLAKRLGEHLVKITGRQKISIAEVRFKCLYVHQNWTALAPESTLIKHYRRTDENVCVWNGNGFGPHDPGRDRETTNKPPDGFDSMYPINDGWVTGIKAGKYNGRDLLIKLKEDLPFLFRYETKNPQAWKRGHPDYNDAVISVPNDDMTAREILRAIAKQLPGWQATAFPSHMILYKERLSYKHGDVLWPK